MLDCRYSIDKRTKLKNVFNFLAQHVNNIVYIAKTPEKHALYCHGNAEPPINMTLSWPPIVDLRAASCFQTKPFGNLRLRHVHARSFSCHAKAKCCARNFCEKMAAPVEFSSIFAIITKFTINHLISFTSSKKCNFHCQHCHERVLPCDFDTLAHPNGAILPSSPPSVK